jgi:hypothetical protein
MYRILLNQYHLNIHGFYPEKNLRYLIYTEIPVSTYFWYFVYHLTFIRCLADTVYRVLNYIMKQLTSRDKLN